MTYNVFGGMLSLTQSIIMMLLHFAFAQSVNYVQHVRLSRVLNELP